MVLLTICLQFGAFLLIPISDALKSQRVQDMQADIAGKCFNSLVASASTTTATPTETIGALLPPYLRNVIKRVFSCFQMYAAVLI